MVFFGLEIRPVIILVSILVWHGVWIIILLRHHRTGSVSGVVRVAGELASRSRVALSWSHRRPLGSISGHVIAIPAALAVLALAVVPVFSDHQSRAMISILSEFLRETAKIF